MGVLRFVRHAVAYKAKTNKVSEEVRMAFDLNPLMLKLTQRPR